MEIAFVMCQLAYLSQCREVEIPLMPDANIATPVQCQIVGMTEISKWMQSHPNHYLKRWTCQRSGQFAKL